MTSLFQLLGAKGLHDSLFDLTSVFRRLAKVLDLLPAVVFTRATQLLLDIFICVVALLFAYSLRFEFAIPPSEWPTLAISLAVIPIFRLICLLALGAYRRIWRYFNLDDALVLTLGSAVPSVMFVFIRFFMPHKGRYGPLPLSVIIIEFGLVIILLASIRLLRRVTFSFSNTTRHEYMRVLLIGSDNSLADAIQRLRLCQNVHVVGLLVPGASLKGLQIGGFDVLGETPALPKLLCSSAIDMVLITDSGLDCIAEVVENSTSYGVDVRLLPDAAGIIRGDVRFATLPRPEAALGREHSSVPPDPLVSQSFRNRIVLITGAGGSIGSELSRQVAQLPVAAIILLDQDENSIFEIRNQLTNLPVTPKLISLVGDICDDVQLQGLFAKYHPEIILHAAAYKHVPVMEENCCEAVRNNIGGTMAVLRAAIQFQAERFLMISTDKAVRPTSVMGASKRVAELAVQALRSNGTSTRCACVRFGNVMGSRGSVVPIFLRQIANGGPVTITDENMTRYFMTIPDAVRLVLQASTIGSQGDIFMLDMGDPVKIMSLARKLIEASGLRPGIDIEIKCVGVRPGEKIHEQLWSDEAIIRGTEFLHVFRVFAQIPPKDFDDRLDQLIKAANTRDESSVLSMLISMPIEFNSERECGASETHAIQGPLTALKRAAAGAD